MTQETPTRDYPAVLQSITQHPFLRGLDQKHLETLASCAMPIEFTAGEIFREGDPANRFYLIQSGKIALQTGRAADRKTVQLLGSDDVLGWSWLFPPYEWHFSARVVEPVKAIFFYGTRLREICESDHDLGYELMKRTADVLLMRLMATRRELLAHRELS